MKKSILLAVIVALLLVISIPAIGNAEESVPPNLPKRLISVSALVPRLGILVLDVNPRVAEALKLDVQSGVLVVAAWPAGPGAQAGLLRGDVIKKVDDVDVTKAREVLKLARDKQKTEFVIVVQRAGEEKTFNVTASQATYKDILRGLLRRLK